MILGAGPAGLSAALVASGNQIGTVILEEKSEIGGQVALADHPITDLLGRDAKDGAELIAHFKQQARDNQLEIRTKAGVQRLGKTADGFEASLRGGERLASQVVLLATGCKPRPIGLENEAELGAFDRARPLAGKVKSAIIAGGGDEATSTAEVLARGGAEVVLLVRGETFAARPLFVQSLLETPNVTIHFGQTVTSLRKNNGRIAVETSGGLELRAERFFSRIGSTVVVPEIDPAPERAADGRVIADDLGLTSVPGLFAAGDVTAAPPRRYIAFAAGSGVVAARSIEAALRVGK